MTKKKTIISVLFTILLIGLLMFTGCYGTTDTGTDGTASTGTSWLPIVFLVGIIVLMYVLMAIPQRRRQKAQQKMMDALNRGDEIITNSGIYGIIERIEENSVVIKLEGGTTMRVIKSSIAGKRPEETM